MDKIAFAAKVLGNAATTAIKNRQVVPTNIQYTISAKNVETPNSLIKILFIGGTSLYFGAYIAREGASFLEENEIFVPSEDDDDD